MHSCYLCGATDNEMTRDHIPPKGLFPKPRPTMITLPCCKSCHGPTGKDDEAFLLAIAATAGNEAGQKIFHKLLAGSSPKLVNAVRKTATMRKLNIPGQEIVVPTHSIPHDRANPVLIRITKGLLTKHHPTYDARYDTFHCSYIVPTERNFAAIAPLFQRLFRRSVGIGVFDYWGNITVEHNAGTWIYCFYRSAIFTVTHFHPGLHIPNKR